MTTDRKHELDRARDYPYEAPKGSYVLYEGEVLDLSHYNIDDMDQRTAVLAYGSNAAPSQLMRKFAATLKDEMIPVLRGFLPGFDVVFSARLSRYGAIPATLARSKGTVLETFVTCLTDGQLARMHETEIDTAKRGGYRFGVLSGVRMLVDRLGLVEKIHLYHYGKALAQDDRPLAYAEITAKDRVLPARAHPEMLAQVHGVSGKAALAKSILRAIDDDEARRAHSECMREDAVVVRLPRFKKILP
jgi:hypothetical protein